MKTKVSFERFLSLLMCLTLIITSLAIGEPINAKAAVISTWDVGATAGTVTATLTDDGILDISGTGAMKAYTSGTAPWYSSRASINSIVISPGVTSIGAYAFAMCQNFTSISIPNTVTTIGAYAFQSCYALTSLTIPSSVTTLPANAIVDAANLRDLYIYGNTTVLTTNYITLSKNYLIVHGYAGSTAQTWATTNKRLFDDMGSSSDVFSTWDIGVTTGTVTATLYKNGTLELTGTGPTKSWTSTTVPWYFYNLFLKNITVGEGVTSIGNYSFNALPSVTSVTLPDSLQTIGDYAFQGCTSLTSIALGDSVTSLGNYAFSGNTLLSNVVLGNSLQSIGNMAFQSCTSLTNITLGDSVRNLGYGIFTGNTSLNNVSLGNSITDITSSMFSGCTSLTSITIPSSVTSIASGAFNGCTSLALAVIPDSVTNIYSNAFTANQTLKFRCSTNSYAYNYALTYFILVEGDEIASQSGTFDIDNLKYTILSAALKTVSLTGYVTKPTGILTIPSTVKINGITYKVTEIGDNAFSTQGSSGGSTTCTGITDVIVPEGVTKIGSYAFCAIPLNSVSLPSTLISLGGGSFYGFRGSEFIFPENAIPNEGAIKTYTSGGYAGNPYIKHIAILNKNYNYYSYWLYNDSTNFPNLQKLTLLCTLGPAQGGTAFGVGIVPIYGLTNSQVQAWCIANNRMFIPLDNASGSGNPPDAPLQTLTYDKYNKTPITFNVNLGSGDTAASGILKVIVGDTELASSKWLYFSSKIQVAADVFDNLQIGSSNYITVVFDDFYETSIKKVKVKIVDTTPISDPSLVIKNPSFDKATPTSLYWDFNYGTTSTAFDLYIDSTKVDSTNYTITNNRITLNPAYLTSLASATHTVQFKFNDAKATISNDTLIIKDTTTIGPVINQQDIKYIGTDINYVLQFGNNATSITEVVINGTVLPTSYYTVTSDTLKILDSYLSVLDNGLYSISIKFNDNTIISDKLSFTVPKDTSSVTPQNSILNILYVNGSTNDLSFPLSGNPTGVTAIYVDSALVTTQNYRFDNTTDVLSISNDFLNALGGGSHSMILTLDYSGTLTVSSAPNTIFMPTVLAAGDTGIIISSVNGGTTGLTYRIDPNGNIVIDGYTGTEQNVTIPSDVNGTPVTGIEDLQDSTGNTNVGSVTIPETVTDIAPGAIPPSASITAPAGSTGEQYANNNGNTYTPPTSGGSDGGSGSTPTNPTAPTVPTQTKQYDVNNPSDIQIDSVNLGNATAIDYIIIGNYKIYADGTIEVIDNIITINEDVASAPNTIFINKNILASAIPFSGVPYTLGPDGKLIINKDLLSQLNLTASQNYDIKLGFNDGTEITNTVSINVIDSSSSGENTTPTPTDPTPTDPTPSTGNGGNGGNGDNGNTTTPPSTGNENTGGSGSTGGGGGSVPSDTTTTPAPVRSIVSVEKTSTDGLVDTYTITYSDGTTSTFTVTNGKDGKDGILIKDIEKTSTNDKDKTNTYTITYTDGTTSTITIPKSDKELETLAKILEQIKLKDGLKEIQSEKGSNEGVTINNIYIDNSVINSTYVYINDVKLAAGQYSYNQKSETLTIDKSALKDLLEGKYTISLALKEVDNTVIASQKISVINIAKNEVSTKVKTVNRTITIGSKVNINIINRSKDSRVSYISSNSKIVSINKKDGIFTAIKAGKSTVTVTSIDKNVKTIYKINITVTNKQGNKAILDTERNIYLNSVIKLNTDAKVVKFEVKNNKILTIAKDGKITPKKIGTTTIKVNETSDQLQLVYTVKVNTKKLQNKSTIEKQTTKDIKK